jgi:molybdate transport system substrate-binding protein
MPRPIPAPRPRRVRWRSRPGALLVATCTAAVAVGAAGCTASNASAGSSGSGSGGLSGTATVFAASSLQEAFTTLGRQFESAHPGTRIVFSFGPSSGLATQIVQGAPADVFASASTANMEQVVEAGAVTAPTPFAANTMEIAVPPSNPGHVGVLADLAKASVKVAVCQPAVPCGAVAAQVFAHAGLTVRAATQESDVKAVLTKVELGEVDAGLVYVTDVRAAGTKVTGIPVPVDLNASTDYPVAVLDSAPHAALADAFTAYVLSEEGSTVLADFGFARP